MLKERSLVIQFRVHVAGRDKPQHLPVLHHSTRLSLRFVVDNSALDDASIQHIHDKEPVLPDGECGYRSERKLGVRIVAAFPLTIHVAIASEFTHQLSGLAIDHLNTVPGGGIQITLAVERLVLFRRNAMTRRKITSLCPK